MSLGFKYYEINCFYLLLNAFINIHKATTPKPKNCKNKIMNNVNQLYNYYFNVYKENYNSENLKERDQIFFDPNQFKILGKKKQKSKSTEDNTERESTEERTERETHGLK